MGPDRSGPDHLQTLLHSHVLDGKVLEYLAVVDVPHSLVVPHLAGEQDGAEGDPLPTAGRDVHLGVLEQPLEVHEGDDGALRGQLRGVEEGPDEAVDLPVLGIVLVVLRVHRVALKSFASAVERDHFARDETKQLLL